MIHRLYSVHAQGEITFTLTYLLQLRLCFGELPYQLRIRFVPGSVPFEESEKHPYVQEMFFSHGNKQRILSWISRLQECSALVESLICKHFSTFLIPCSLHLFLLFFGTLHSDACIFPFLLCFLPLFFSQVFVRPPQTALCFFAFLFHGDDLERQSNDLLSSGSGLELDSIWNQLKPKLKTLPCEFFFMRI